jgi:hypothetical protein
MRYDMPQVISIGLSSMDSRLDLQSHLDTALAHLSLDVSGHGPQFLDASWPFVADLPLAQFKVR